jgi:Leucine-rich repeat (LRR) protein
MSSTLKSELLPVIINQVRYEGYFVVQQAGFQPITLLNDRIKGKTSFSFRIVFVVSDDGDKDYEICVARCTDEQTKLPIINAFNLLKEKVFPAMTTAQPQPLTIEAALQLVKTTKKETDTTEDLLERELMAQDINTTSLDLSKRQLKFLPKSLFLFAENLQELFLTNNAFESLSESITQLSSLQKLHLSFNQLSTLPSCLSEMRHLTYLDVSSNKSQLSLQALQSMTQLQTLFASDMTNVQIDKLPSNLLHLRLERCHISALDHFNRFQYLRTLELPYNEIVSISPSLSLHQLTRLDLSYHQSVKSGATQLLQSLSDRNFRQLQALAFAQEFPFNFETIANVSSITSLTITVDLESAKSVSKLSKISQLELVASPSLISEYGVVSLFIFFNQLCKFKFLLKKKFIFWQIIGGSIQFTSSTVGFNTS